MSEAAARLRAQKAYSTDPEYLERMAVWQETRAGLAPRANGGPQAIGSKSLLDRPVAPSGSANADRQLVATHAGTLATNKTSQL